MEVPSPVAGKIVEVLVKAGDKVSQGSAIAKVEAATEAKAEAPAEAATAAPETPPEAAPAATAGGWRGGGAGSEYRRFQGCRDYRGFGEDGRQYRRRAVVNRAGVG